MWSRNELSSLAEVSLYLSFLPIIHIGSCADLDCLSKTYCNKVAFRQAWLCQWIRYRCLTPVINGARSCVSRQVRRRDLFCSRSADAVALLSIIRSGCADSDSIVPSSESSYALFFLYASTARCWVGNTFPADRFVRSGKNSNDMLHSDYSVLTVYTSQTYLIRELNF